MINRKEFIRNSVCAAVGLASANVIADIVNDNADDSLMHKHMCKHAAERYVDMFGKNTVTGPFTDKNGKNYFSAPPVGFVYSSDDTKHYAIELPSKVRRVYTDKYDVHAKKTLVSQLEEYFLNEQIWKNGLA